MRGIACALSSVTTLRRILYRWYCILFQNICSNYHTPFIRMRCLLVRARLSVAVKYESAVPVIETGNRGSNDTSLHFPLFRIK